MSCPYEGRCSDVNIKRATCMRNEKSYYVHEYPSPTSVEWPYLPSGDDLRFQTTCDDTGYDLPYPLSTWVWK